MTKRALVAFTLASLLIILAAAVAMRALADDGTSAQELPEPSALSHDEVLLLRAEAPALERGGLNRYPMFAEVFAAARRTGGRIDQVVLKTVQTLSGRLEVREEIGTLLKGRRYEQKIMNPRSCVPL